MASMMYLIYNNDGSIQTLIVPKSIQQGNNGVDKIFVSVVGRSVTGANSYTCSANFTLPDGEITQLVGSVTLNEEVGYKYYDGYTITLTEAQTEQSGKLKMSIYVKDINDNTLYTYRYEFQVNPTPYDPDEALINTALYNSLVQSLNSYLLKVDADKVSGNTIYLKSDIKNQTINDFLEVLEQGQDCVVWTRANEVPCIVAVNTDYQSSGNYQLIQREINTNNYKVITGTLSEIGNYGMYNDSHWTTNEFYTKTQVDSALSNKANTNDVYTKEQIDDKGYVTETWVVNQEYLVQSDLGGYATETYVATQLQSYDVTIKTWVDNQSYATSGDVSSVLNLLNYNVHIEVQQHEFTFNGDTVTFTCSYVNLKTGVTGTRAETIPLANSTTAGLMSYEDYNTLISNTNRISALEGRQFRLTYTASQSPSASDIKSFVTTYLAGIGITSPTDSDYNGVSVVVSGTNHVWNYYANLSTYQDDGVDFVTIFTNSVPGIIQGTNDNTSHTNDGKVYAESNGTGSVLGWDRLTTRVYNLENGGYITVNVTNLVNYYDKDTIDLMLNDYATTTDISDMATTTWVQQQGYLTSLPSNVAYKDINNAFSVSQWIYGNDDTCLELVANDTTHSNIMFRDKNNLALGNIGFNSNKKPEINDKNTNTWRELALKDDTLKNAYHSGAFDGTPTTSNGITKVLRATCRHTFDGSETIYNVSSTYPLYYINFADLGFPYLASSVTDIVSNFGYTAKSVSNVNYTPNGIEISNGSVYFAPTSEIDTIDKMRAILLGKEIQCYLPSAYQYYDYFTQDLPISTLDQQGETWLRNEWENQLQLFDKDLAQNGYIRTANGKISGYADYCLVDFIPCKPNTTYTCTYFNRICFMDSSKNYIDKIEALAGIDVSTFTTPSNCYYMCIDLLISNKSICMLNKGDHAYPYVPYNKFKGFLKDEYKKTLNLFDYDNRIANKSITSTGSLVDDNTRYSVFALVKPNTTYTKSGGVDDGYATYDMGMNFIAIRSGNTFTTESNVYYIGISCPNSSTTPMLSEGDTQQPFEDYNGKVIHQKDVLGSITLTANTTFNEIFNQSLGKNVLTANAPDYVSLNGATLVPGFCTITISGSTYTIRDKTNHDYVCTPGQTSYAIGSNSVSWTDSNGWHKIDVTQAIIANGIIIGTVNEFKTGVVGQSKAIMAYLEFDDLVFGTATANFGIVYLPYFIDADYSPNSVHASCLVVQNASNTADFVLTISIASGSVALQRIGSGYSTSTGKFYWKEVSGIGEY